MFDLNNREYEKVMAYIPNEAVVFKMKNGLAYRVSLGGRIFIDAVWWNFFKMSPYYEVGDKTPKDVLQKAVEILKTAEVPKLSKEKESKFEKFLKQQGEFLKEMSKYDKQIEDFKKKTLPWTESTDIKAWLAEEKRLLKQRKDAGEKYWNSK